ncbi:hypothetical protein Tco_1366088 [Tanacetum coccineum]
MHSTATLAYIRSYQNILNGNHHLLSLGINHSLKNELVISITSSCVRRLHIGLDNLGLANYDEWTENATFVLLEEFNDRQCRTRFETLKLKYKKEKAKMDESGMGGLLWEVGAPDYDVLEDCMFMQLGRRSLRSEDWVEVAEKVSDTCKMEINDGQCRARFATLKFKYKKEKAKMEGSGMMGEMGGYYGKWGFFNKMDMLLSSKRQPFRDDEEEEDEQEEDEEGFKLLEEPVQNFGEIYEKIERRKRQQIMELEKMRMDFHRELELQKKVILERAQANIAKIREEVGEDASSVENLSG